MTRNPNHHDSVAALSWPVAKDRLPASQARALTSNSQVCDAAWRRTTTMLTPVKTTEAATISQAPASGRPASRHTPPRADASGARKAAGSFTATARSRPITVPRKAQIISAAWASPAWPSQTASRVAGTTTPDPQQAAGDAAPAARHATSTRNSGRAAMAAGEEPRLARSSGRAITSP